MKLNPKNTETIVQDNNKNQKEQFQEFLKAQDMFSKEKALEILEKAYAHK